MKFTPIGIKIMKKFLVVVTILGALNVTSLYFIKKIERSYSDLINRRVQIITLLHDIQKDILKKDSIFRSYLLTDDPAFMKSYYEIHDQIDDEVGKALVLSKVEVNKQKLKRIAGENDRYMQKLDELMGTLPADDDAAARIFDSKVLPISQEIIKISQSLIEFHQTHMYEDSSSNSEIVNRSIMISLFIMAIDVIILIGIVYYYYLKLRLPVLPVLKG